MYVVVHSKESKKALKKMNSVVMRRMDQMLERIAEDPYGPGSASLRGSGSLRRYKKGGFPYRIIYEVDEGQVKVLIVRIGHRKEVYKGI